MDPQLTHKLPLHSDAMTSETAPQHQSRRWSRRQTLAAVVVAAMIGGIGGAAIYAATQAPPHMGGGPHGVAGPMHGPPPPGGGPPPGAPPAPAEPSAAGAVHSESVVTDGNGGFTTKLTQTGVVDEVTLTNVVVRSPDGYTQIYTFPSAASSSSRPVAVNDNVTVDATRTGTTVTLNSIGDTPPTN
jgi:hypothetical protein